MLCHPFVFSLPLYFVMYLFIFTTPEWLEVVCFLFYLGIVSPRKTWEGKSLTHLGGKNWEVSPFFMTSDTDIGADYEMKF